MNGKQSRNLRNLVKTEMAGMQPLAYKNFNTKVKPYSIGFNAQGIEQFGTYTTHTVVLDACQRKVYQKAKRLHNAYLGQH